MNWLRIMSEIANDDSPASVLGFWLGMGVGMVWLSWALYIIFS